MALTVDWDGFLKRHQTLEYLKAVNEYKEHGTLTVGGGLMYLLQGNYILFVGRKCPQSGARFERIMYWDTTRACICSLIPNDPTTICVHLKQATVAIAMAAIESLHAKADTQQFRLPSLVRPSILDKCLSLIHLAMRTLLELRNILPSQLV